MLKLNISDSLANQQIIDCSAKFGNNGCNGGAEVNVWKYLRATKGIMLFSDYPYDNRRGKCRYNKNKIKARVTSFKRHLRVSNKKLKEIVARVGPVCVAIHVTPKGMADYGGGVYTDNECRSEMRYLNHAVTLVGYGTEKGKDYWLIKNSWGDSWGESGTDVWMNFFECFLNNCSLQIYIGYLKLDMKRNCGVTTDVSYPKVTLPS